jgi:endonuclease YncB( thermonuclease family)
MPRMRPAVLVLTVILTLASIASAQTFSAKVVGITDGDTITVLENTGRQDVIRLTGIDAPEHGQPYATQSENHLRELVFGRTVNLDCQAERSYGREVCKVLLPNGEDIDLDLVKAGLAWHYKQYAFAQTPQDRAAYAAAEDTAREGHLGLWADPHPVQPQDFRHGTQSKLCFASGDHRIACSEQYEGPVRGNQRSHIYHWPGCPNYDDISPYNRVEFPNRQAAEAAGFTERRETVRNGCSQMKNLCWAIIALCALAAAIAGAFLFMIVSPSVRVTFGAAIGGSLISLLLIAVAVGLLSAVVLKGQRSDR